MKQIARIVLKEIVDKNCVHTVENFLKSSSIVHDTIWGKIYLQFRFSLTDITGVFKLHLTITLSIHDWYSSLRIGGAVPTVFSYFSEVLAREKRGEHLSWLCMFWMIGGIYASAMAWAIIPHYGKKTSCNLQLFQYESKALLSLI